MRGAEACDDGFALAEEDLRQRGMGDLAGLRQAGENAEGLIDPERDLELLEAARRLVEENPALARAYGPRSAATAPDDDRDAAAATPRTPEGAP